MHHQEELALPLAWGRLCGTLVLPGGAGPWPAALLVAGSGPTDRDGNNPLLEAPVDNLKLLAHGLAARGVASLRYDKRGVGQSQAPGLTEPGLRFDQLVDDAVACAQWLAADARLAGLALVGHSEGALIASLAAARIPAQALVTVAGAGERASALMRRQLAGTLTGELAAAAQAALDALEDGQAVPDMPAALVLLFRPSVQPYLISWFRHDPAQALAALATPLLLVHGTADPQVALAQAGLLKAARPDAAARIIEGMDHLLAIGGSVTAGTEVLARELAPWLRATVGTQAPG